MQKTSQAPLQELDYLVTADDIAYLNHYHTQRSPILRRQRRVVGAVTAILGIFGFLGFLPLGGVLPLMMMIMALIGVFVAAGVRKTPTRQHVERVRKLFDEGRNRALFGHHHIRLLQDHLEVSTEFSRGEVKWEGVERVEHDENYVFIYISALNAYVINKRYFPGEEHAQAFFESAYTLHQEAVYGQNMLTHHPAAPLGSGRALPAPVPPQAPRLPVGGPPQAPRKPALGSSGGTDGSI